MKSVKEMPTKRRWFMLFLLCLVIGINYLDRGNLGVAAPVMPQEVGLSPATMGNLFSAFAWSYAFCLPFAGALLDKIGPRILMTIALVGWSAATFAMGLVSQLWNLIAVRLGLGFFESPIMPSNIKCVAVWFPDRERALAVGAYTATEYVALGVLTPVLAWILVTFGWEMIFFVTGVIGFVIGGIWYKWYRSPGDSAEVNDAEWQYMKAGGALLGGETGKRPGVVRPDTNDSVNAHSNPVASSTKISGKGEKNETTSLTQWQATKKLITNRRLIGMFLGQFSIMTTLFFFLTWFPSYLVTEKGLTILKSGFYAMFPFLVAIAGSLIGGKWSDSMLDSGKSKTLARKLPIILGFLLSTVIVAANYVDSIPVIIAFMAVAFFGQAMASTVTGALLSDLAPAGYLGVSGGLLNFFANLGSATCPLVIGFIVDGTGSFAYALAYVGAVALCGVIGYTLVLTKVERISI
uniref:MFS transporter n=1 Tax=Veillonella magna TaxID=464322 RepID=UPI00402A9FD8